MLSSPVNNEFCWQLSSQAGVRPAAAYGDVVTANAAAHTKGVYTAIFPDTEVVNVVYGVLINLNSADVATAARNHLTDIAWDPAGGTSYQDRIPNLLSAAACDLLLASGVWYYFPVFIKAGSEIAARTQSSTGAATIRVWMQLFGKPTHPELCRVGQKVVAYGANTGTSAGVAMTPGTTSDGAYVTIAAPAESCWFWQLGIGCGDTTQNPTLYFCDLAYGAAGSEKLIIEDLPKWNYTSSEEGGVNMAVPFACYRSVQAGTIIRGRSQCNGTADATFTVAAYGVTG